MIAMMREFTCQGQQRNLFAPREHSTRLLEEGHIAMGATGSPEFRSHCSCCIGDCIRTLGLRRGSLQQRLLKYAHNGDATMQTQAGITCWDMTTSISGQAVVVLQGEGSQCKWRLRASNGVLASRTFWSLTSRSWSVRRSFFHCRNFFQLMVQEPCDETLTSSCVPRFSKVVYLFLHNKVRSRARLCYNNNMIKV
jgi:hypothetical protein